jgi:hypothetical protein
MIYLNRRNDLTNGNMIYLNGRLDNNVINFYRTTISFLNY